MLEELITISRYFGNNPEYIIAGGGNTSFKDENTIWVKASGISLKTIDQSGFVDLSREMLKAIESREYSNNPADREHEVKEDLYKAVISSNKRPSVETSLHNSIDYTYVVHTHPTRLNGLLCSTRARELSEILFGADALFIQYIDPGYTLFKEVLREITGYKNKFGYCPKIILLENHGVFVASNRVSEIEAIYHSIEEKINNVLGNIRIDFTAVQLSAEKIVEIASAPSLRNKAVIGFQGGLIDHFVNCEANYARISRPFTPDHIVYCKSNYLYLKDTDNANSIEESMVQFRSRHGHDAKVIAIKGLGIITIDDSEKLARDVFGVFYDMMKIGYYAACFGIPKPMSDKQIRFIDNWEVENYRRQVQAKMKS
jgi:rhamnose utilization protein RhaD (predicted bifunctional aldolase and dehydrogenase)